MHDDGGNLSLIKPDAAKYTELAKAKVCGFTWAHPALSDVPRRIDLLTSIDGVSFGPSFARRQIVAVDGVELPIIGLADFKTNKQASGRTQDRADLEALGDDAD